MLINKIKNKLVIIILLGLLSGCGGTKIHDVEGQQVIVNGDGGGTPQASTRTYKLRLTGLSLSKSGSALEATGLPLTGSITKSL